MAAGVPVITVPGSVGELVAGAGVVAERAGWGGVVEGVEAFIRSEDRLDRRRVAERARDFSPEAFLENLKEALTCS